MRKKLISWFLIISVVSALFAAFPMSAFALNKDTMNNLCPIYAYPQSWDDDGYFPTYTTNECTTKAGKIHKNDYCTISKFYYKNDKWVVKVTYPVSGGTKTAYAKAIRFFPDCYSTFEPYKVTAASKTYVSTKAGAATESGWYISSGDKFYVITRDSDGNAQVVYPLDSGGYKMGWIKHYDVKFNANGGSGTPSTQHKIQNVNLALSSTVPSRTGYTFKNWNTSKDGSGTKYSSGATYTGNKAITLYAQWKANSYGITVYSANPDWGYVTTGGGTFDYGTPITINAIAEYGYEFAGWSDGDPSATKTIEVSGAATYIAYFKVKPFTMTVYSDDLSMGTVGGGGPYNYLTYATITAYPKPGHHFVEWDDEEDDNPRSVHMEGDESYTAYFAKNEYDLTAYIYDIDTNLRDNTIGSVSNTGTYEYGDYVTITATPSIGYRFVQWNDGNTSATRTVHVSDNVNYYAYFKVDPDTCPHTFGDYTEQTPSTCTEEGLRSRVCSKCNIIETDIIAKKTHTLGEWIVDTVATCETAGSHHQVCNICTTKMAPEEIPPLGHDYKETIVEPTCTVKGLKTSVCKRDGCGHTVVEEIRYPGHNYELSDSSKDGYATLICSLCNDIIEKKLYTFGEDTYSFLNDATIFARKVSRLNRKEKDPTFDIKTFYAVFSDKPENYVQTVYNSNKFWNGVCFGMSVSSLAFYQKDLNLIDYTDEKTVYEIEAPKEYISNGGVYSDNVKGPLMVHLRSLIEFFQISQHRDEIIIEYFNNISSDEFGWNKLDDLITAVKRFVDTGEDGVIIRIQGESGQHAVVPVSYDEYPNDCEFAIGIYDNSSPESVYTLKIFKDDTGNYSGFEYQGNRYRQLISYNMVDTVYNLMVGTMVDGEDNNADISEILSYARIYTNSDDVTITDLDGVDISALNEVYRITVADSSDNGIKYLVPYGDYVVTNNNETIEEFEVSIIGPKDTKIVNSKDNKSTVHVGIHADKKSTYAKVKKSNSDASLFSTNSDTATMSVMNISNDGIRDLVEVDAEYVVLDTSNGTLDIASDVSTVKLNGDKIAMMTVDVENEPSDENISIETSSGIIVNIKHMGALLGSTVGSTSSGNTDDSEKITSCQIGAQNIGFSSDAINNSEYNYTLSVKSNDLQCLNGIVSGEVEFNIYNNSEASNFAYVLFSAFANDGTLMGEYLHETMLGINNNYVNVDDVYIEVPVDNEFYIMASVIDMDDVQISDEVELILPTESDYSLRVVSDNLTWETSTIRGDVQINVHTKDSISGDCKVYLCFYDTHGKLLDVYAKDVTIEATNTYVPFTEISVPCTTNVWNAKCLLWADTNRIIPLANPVVLSLNDEAE